MEILALKGPLGTMVQIGSIKAWAETKRVFLEYGAAHLLAVEGNELPYWKIPVIAYGEPYNLEGGTTDPILVCIARRGWNGEKPVETPTLEEAMAELASGKDQLGREWPIPQARPEPIEETLARASYSFYH